LINRLHSITHRPEKGWDPIPADYARSYSDLVSRQFDTELIPSLSRKLGGLAGRRVLDLGGGPGHYTVAFAQEGARVTWFDISRAYQAIAADRASAAGVQISFVLGYFEQADQLAGPPFDLVFNHLCWYYAMSDRGFARLIFNLVQPSGSGYIETPNSRYADDARSRPFVYWLNERFWIKIGHPFPPPGRVGSLMNRRDLRFFEVNYSSPDKDIVFFTR
jgi:2-polyprenyl-3-methyl-5-hydroxy-6-metoxy-1,4-benzoquinol methylase